MRKCPNCGKVIVDYSWRNITLRPEEFGNDVIHAVEVLCPHCKHVFNVINNPDAIAIEAAARVLNSLQNRTI